MKKLQIKKPSPLSANRRYKLQLIFLIVATLALFAMSGLYWYRNVLTNPDRLLGDMLNKSLQTESLFRSVSQGTGRNSVSQDVYVAFSPKTISKSVSELKESSQAGNTTVVTETLGTKTTDFVRYTGIDVQGNNPNQDFKSVLNVWGKKDSDPEQGTRPTFLSEALFLVVPFGNLNPDQRSQLKNEIDRVNLYHYTKSTLDFENGRPIARYDMEIDPQSLITVLRKYVELTGVGNPQDLDPAAYEGAQAVRVEMKVDILSRHLKAVNFTDSDRRETYAGYNVPKEISLPNETITIDELQTKLQAVEPQQPQPEQQQ